MKKMNNKGFSLIELIIVIAIMAVLVAVIAPNLTGYIGKSKKNTDTSNADTIAGTLANALQDFTTDSEMRFEKKSETDAAAAAKAADGYLVGANGVAKIHVMNTFIAKCATADADTFLGNVYTSLKKYITNNKIDPKVTSNAFYIMIDGTYDKGYTCKVISFDKTKTPQTTDFK